MRSNKTPKISVSGPQPGLNATFSELEIPNLPAGPTEEVAPMKAAAAPASAWKLGRVVLRRERSQRGGKTVIVIDDFASHLPLTVIETTARNVRQACGCGGTVKGRTVEIQGDQAERVRMALELQGFQVAGVR